ncbi:MAG: MBL fold metallo-hydrolase [Bacilli bacterium]|nr:MBL fold metallo-hydrolase [Bacilli bacterium]
MKLRVLADNNTFINMYYLGEPAVSYYIEDDGECILFDAGYSDAYIKNAESMGIDLRKVTKLVISHGHNDHTGGLPYILKMGNNMEVITHPKTFVKKEARGEDIGSPWDENMIREYAKITLSKEPVNITKNLIYLGEIPQTTNFEKRDIIGTTDNDNHPDDILEDSALCLKTDKGLFIITGCSHSGICNILEYAKKISGDKRIYGVIGGFHLFDKDERLKETLEYLKSEHIPNLYPCHCISLDAKVEMGKVMDIKEVGVGLEVDV